MRVVVDPDCDQMGFAKIAADPFFVDKTGILSMLWEHCGAPSRKYMCVTRPDGFGKSTAASMIASFFGPGDSAELFDGLAISQHPRYSEFLNTHHVIYMDLTVKKFPNGVEGVLASLEDELIYTLSELFPEVPVPVSGDISLFLNRIFSKTSQRFVFVIDEWDHILRTGGLSDREKRGYQAFFTSLLKGQAYVALAFMTGVLPVVPMTSGSGLNMFSNFTVTRDPFFSTIFGFTDPEVDELYTRYVHREGQDSRISRQDLQAWCGGYTTKTGDQLYNPRSVVEALSRNTLGTSRCESDQVNDVFDVLRHSEDGDDETVSALLAGESVSRLLNEWFVGKDHLTACDDILSVLLAHGLLTLDTTHGYYRVKIPNEQIRNQYVRSILKHPEF